MFSVLIHKRIVFFLTLGLAAGMLLLSLINFGVLKKVCLPSVNSIESEPACLFDPPPTNNTNNIDLLALQKIPAIRGNDSDFFVEYRIDRERTRGQQIELLREIIGSSSSDEQTRNKAQEELLAISHKMSKEMELEHVLQAKGYRDATICIEEKGVTVIIQLTGEKSSSQITQEEISEICKIVSRGTAFDEQDIIVIAKN